MDEVEILEVYAAMDRHQTAEKTTTPWLWQESQQLKPAMKASLDFHDATTEDGKHCKEQSGGPEGAGKGKGKGRKRLSIDQFKNMSRCASCGVKGHWHRECTEPKNNSIMCTLAETHDHDSRDEQHDFPEWAFDPEPTLGETYLKLFRPQQRRESDDGASHRDRVSSVSEVSEAASTQERWTQIRGRALARDAAIERRVLELAAERRLAPLVRGERQLVGPTDVQIHCPHPPARIMHWANQYAAWTKCAKCNLRLDHYDKCGVHKTEMMTRYEQFTANKIEENVAKRSDRRGGGGARGGQGRYGGAGRLRSAQDPGAHREAQCPRPQPAEGDEEAQPGQQQQCGGRAHRSSKDAAEGAAASPSRGPEPREWEHGHEQDPVINIDP